MDSNIVSGDVVAPAASKAKLGTAIDSSGRKITVKPLDPLETYRLARVMGPSADVEVARAYGSMAASVRAINDEPQSFPNSDRDIQATLQLLGSEGIDAVQKALGEIAEAKNPVTSTDAVKN